MALKYSISSKLSTAWNQTYIRIYAYTYNLYICLQVFVPTM